MLPTLPKIMFDIHVIDNSISPQVVQTFGLKQINFSEKMILKLLHGATSAIIQNYRDADDEEEIPKKGDLYYIAEPFARKYGWKNDMRTLYSITYLADQQEEILDTGFSEIDQYGSKFQAEAMLESEARFFIKVKRCRYRKLDTIKLSKTAHQGLYDIHKSDSVLVMDFELVSKDYVSKKHNQILFESIF